MAEQRPTTANRDVHVDHDPVRDAASVEAGIYRHESHNWCFQHNMPAYDLKPLLPSLRCPVLVTVGRHDWVTPVSMSETIADLVPDVDWARVVIELTEHMPVEDYTALNAAFSPLRAAGARLAVDDTGSGFA